MRRAIIIIATLGFVGAAVLVARARALPDEAREALRHPEIAAARQQLQAQNDTLRAWSNALGRARTLAAAASATRGDAPFLLEARVATHPETRAAFARMFERELSELPPPRVPLRALLVEDGDASIAPNRTWYLRPHTAGDPCVMVVRVRARPDVVMAPRPRERRLGVCELYARHGMPGAGIGAWLDSTGASGARSATVTADVSRPERTSRKWERMFGLAMVTFVGPIACVAGRDSACTAAIRRPYTLRTRGPKLTVADDPKLSSAYYFEADNYPGDITAALRAHLGPERFERWWRSDLPPDQAYEAVTGAPFAEWMRAYLRPQVGDWRAGPLRAELPVALGVGLTVLLAWGATRFTRRARS